MKKDRQQLIIDLNDFIYEAFGNDTQHSFWMYTNSWYEAIMFNKVLLWDSENYESEPTVKSIKAEFKKYLDEISKIKLKP